MIVFLKLSLAIPLILSLRNPAFTKRQSHPAGVRVLKPPSIRWFLWGVLVAPRRGACVETTKTERKSTATSSHPAGVRVLKHPFLPPFFLIGASHPAGVRVLKLIGYASVFGVKDVAPRRGACVETNSCNASRRCAVVAPRRGACVETT